MPTGKELAAAGPKYLGTPYSKMDCQTFVERCLADIGIRINLPGSNAWYREMDWVGSPEECRKKYGKVPTGAFLFILDDVGPKTPEKYRHDGLGDATHMGIVTGMGLGAIHSSETKGCVAESEFASKTIKNGGWNRVGLWNQIDYGLKKEGEPVDEVIEDVLVRTGGGALNLRKSPGGALIDRIPDGDTVDVYEKGPEWCRIGWHGYSGYVATQYLVFEGDTGDLIQVSRTELQEIYDRLGGLLGLRG